VSTFCEAEQGDRMTLKDKPVSTTFDAIAQYAIAKGHKPIKGKLYHVILDEQWEFWVNATNSEQHADGAPIKPFECYVKFNGWPAGIFTPYSGQFAAGEAANEETFCAALKAAVRP
jgi:hypothetical protein